MSFYNELKEQIVHNPVKAIGILKPSSKEVNNEIPEQLTQFTIMKMIYLILPHNIECGFENEEN